MIPAFGEIGEALRRSTVQIRDDRGGAGSGVVWDSSGLIVTNAHVLQQQKASVELWDGRRFEARLATRDAGRDLATLSIPAHQLQPATPGDSGRLRPGEVVVAVGNPLGFTGALSTGIIHSTGPLDGLGRRTWVQADIRLAPGNSGGPLADALGRVIGINTMIVRGGLALAIPVNTVQQFLKSGPSAQLGVTVQPVRLAQRDAVGLLVLDVVPGGPAENASLRGGDVLTAANGKPFRSVNDLPDLVDDCAGRAMKVEFIRGQPGRKREVTVRLQGKATI